MFGVGNKGTYKLQAASSELFLMDKIQKCWPKDCRHTKLFVFDIETIPDPEATKTLLDIKSDDPLELKEAMENYHTEKYNNPFPRQPFHKIIAISFLTADITVCSHGTEQYSIGEIRSGGNENSTEKELVKGIFDYLSLEPYRLVSFNGRTFDLPVLKYRAMKYKICVPWLYKSGDKWSNYMQRYSENWHCDLLDTLSDYGASARIKMHEACSIMAIPGKFGIDGSMVFDQYQSGKIKEIREYCETDVISTYLLYLRHQHHKGVLTDKALAKAEDDVAILMQKKNPQDNSRMGEFLQMWQELQK